MSVISDVEIAEPKGFRWVPGNVAWGVLSFAGGIGLWWLATVAGFSELPSPWAVLTRMIALGIDGQLWGDMYASLRRVLIGFALGAVLAAS